MNLAGNVIRFTQVLRTVGIPIGTDKVLDAVRVLPLTGIERRADCHATLSALFLTRREQQPVFDEAFARFWAPPQDVERAMALKLPKVAGPLSQPPVNPGRVREALMPLAAHLSRQEAPPDSVEIDAALTFSASERLQRLDFERMTAEEWEEARRAVSRLRLPLPRARLRRYRAVEHGPAIDLPRTLRRMARDGGDLTRLARRARVERMPPLVVLCDVSGSMHRYTRMFLHFVHAVARPRLPNSRAGSPRVSAFLFGTRLTNVSRALRDRDVDDALSRMSILVPDWAGGTRIGACLREFNYRWSRRLLAQNACVLLVSDGLDRDDATGLADEMARLHRSCRRLLWLNPLLRYDGFEPRASGIASMLPHVDAFLPVHNLASLAQLAAVLENPLMELTGRRVLAVERAVAWRALNDPEVLRKAVPGCESLEATGPNEYAAVLAAAIGPVRARFRGKLRLEDVVEPSGYTLRFEGDGGAAGFANGVAKVKLSDEGAGTALDYQVNSQIGGKLAQVGNRLVDSVARKLAEDFFAAFEKQLPPPAAAKEAPPSLPAPPPRHWASNTRVWIGAFAVAVVLLLLLRLTLR